MEGQSRSCPKYLLLQVWCALLTVSMVVMAALLTAVRTKTGEVGVSTVKPDDFSPTVNPVEAALKSEGTSLSFIQLIKSQDGRSWDEWPRCWCCSLVQEGGAITCKQDGLYFLYAQVTFRRPVDAAAAAAAAGQTMSVVLRRKASSHRTEKTLAEGMFPAATGGAVWLAKLVELKDGDAVTLHVTGHPVGVVYNDNTYWGAYQLRRHEATPPPSACNSTTGH